MAPAEAVATLNIEKKGEGKIGGFQLPDRSLKHRPTTS